MANFYCKCRGQKLNDVRTLTSYHCLKSKSEKHKIFQNRRGRVSFFLIKDLRAGN